MSRYRPVIAVAALAAVLWPSTAGAQGMENTRSVSISVGTGLGLGGNVITEAVGSLNGTPTVFVEQSYGNHFSDALRVRVMGNVGLDYNKEAFVTFAYNKMNATERVTGSVGGYPLIRASATRRLLTWKVASATTSSLRVRREHTSPASPGSGSRIRLLPRSGCWSWG